MIFAFVWKSSTIVSRSIQCCCKWLCFLIFYTWVVFHLYVYHIFFFRSSLDGHLGCIHGNSALHHLLISHVPVRRDLRSLFISLCSLAPWLILLSHPAYQHYCRKILRRGNGYIFKDSGSFLVNLENLFLSFGCLILVWRSQGFPT